MPVDIDDLNARELDSLVKAASKRKTVLKKRKTPATVRRKVDALLKAEGYTLEELYGASVQAPARKAAKKSTAGRKLGKVPPKYRNPANKDETWTGRGRQPRWLAEQVARGKKPEDFLIKK